MRDQVSIARIEALHPRVRKVFKDFVEEAEKTLNVTLRVTQGLRTVEEQDALYAQGRTKPGNVVTNARGGSSFHNYGLAIDLVEIKAGSANWNFDYKKLKPIALKYGLEWGGDWKTIVDKPHFQESLGYKWQDLYKKYVQKDFLKDTKYVRI